MKRVIMTLALLSFAGILVLAQNITVTGVVLDAQTQDPVPGAAVFVQGVATNGVAAGNDGSYSISVSPDATLVCFCFGYEEATAKVNGRAVLDFSLKVDAVMLDETVVVGYGTLKKSQLVGSVEQLSGEVLEDRVTPNISRSLQGMVPGLTIMQPDGKPTHSGEIYIRGNSTSYVDQTNNGKREHSIGQGGSALILIDGVEGDFSIINPDDVESISVLKDASSSAIYGAKAAYGVILVTTKNAKKGKTKVTYNASLSLHQRTVLWEDNIITDGLTYVERFYEHFINWSETPTAPGGRPSQIGFYDVPTDFLEQYRAWYNGEMEVPADVDYKNLFCTGYNYLEMFYKRMNTSTTHNLSVSGSHGKVSYLISGRYYWQDGIYRIGDESFNSYDLRSKINFEVTDNLSIDNNTSLSRKRYKEPVFTKSYDAGVGTQLHQIAMQGFPIMSPYNPDGTFTAAAAVTGYRAFLEGNSAQEECRTVFSNTLGVNWTPIKDVLKFRADFSFKNVRRDVDRYGPGISYTTEAGASVDYITPQDSYRRFMNYGSDVITANAVATYTPQLGNNHNLNLVAGWNLEYTDYFRRATVRKGLLAESHPNFELMDGEITLADGGYQYGLVGFFARANYTLFGRYIMEASARYDGSSKFPANQQWGLFPSASIGWRLSEEPWMKWSRSWLNNLKFRANAGSLGNGSITPYAFISKMGVSKTSMPFDGELINKISFPSVIPDNLTWEKVTTYDVGLDLDVLNSRLSFSGDYYIKNNTNLYINGPELPAVFGESAPKGNYGALQTKGWEVTLSWRDAFKLGGKDFEYSIKGSLWDSRTWVTDFYNESGNIYNYYVGKELGEIWGFRTDGYFLSNDEAKSWHPNTFHVYRPMSGPYAGDLRFVDTSKDGVISAGSFTLDSYGDLERIGNTRPRFQFGVNLNFKWNGIGISAFLQGVGRRDWYPSHGTDMFWGGYSRAYVAYILKTQSDENTVRLDKSTPNWQVTNSADRPYWTRRGYAQAYSNLLPLSFPNDYYLQNAAYVRLKNLTIDYSFPKKLLEKARIDQLKVYVTGENLFTWSPLFKHTDMFDPEVIQTGDSDFHAASASGDGYSYPMLRSVTFGLSITF